MLISELDYKVYNERLFDINIDAKKKMARFIAALEREGGFEGDIAQIKKSRNLVIDAMEQIIMENGNAASVLGCDFLYD